MSPPTGRGSVLVFEIGALTTADEGGGAYGIEVSQILQVIEPKVISPVPLTPPCVLGIMNHHGRIVTVVDPVRLLKIRARELEGPESRVILLRQGQRSTSNVGLRVTRVHTILAANELEEAEVPAATCVAWVAQQGRRLINILLADSLLEELGREFGSSISREPRQGAGL